MNKGHVSRLLCSLTVGALVLSACAALRPGTAPETLTAQVANISSEYANINTDLSQEALAMVGIVHGSTFRVRFGDDSVDVFFGKTYEDVARDEWVGLIEEDGTLQIAISFGHAATVMGCTAGDTLRLTRLDVR